MKRNLMALLTAVLVVVFVFVACGRNPNYDNGKPYPMLVLDDAPYHYHDDDDNEGEYSGYENLQDVSFTIERISADDIAGIGEFTEFEYRADRIDNFGGDNILIRVNQPISDFTLLGLQDAPDGDHLIVVTERFENIGEITPDRPLLIKSFLWSGGALPRQGFSFVTPMGEFKYHHWAVSPMDDSLNWTAFHWHPDYGLYEIGYQY
jgi:hypothetical protein